MLNLSLNLKQKSQLPSNQTLSVMHNSLVDLTYPSVSATPSLSTEINSIPKDRKFYCHTPEVIAQQLRVDGKGNLWWIKRKRGRQNKPVGYLNDRGRLTTGIDGKIYLNHVLCFCLYYGRWPNIDMHIDHINGVKTDNRKENLREVTRSENTLNSNKSRGKSGYRNIFFDNYTGLWRVTQNINGKFRSKYFKILEDALIFRDSARNEFGIINFDSKLDGISL